MYVTFLYNIVTTYDIPSCFHLLTLPQTEQYISTRDAMSVTETTI